ncbi:ATP-binding protein [Dyadobacter fanqingshengii]|uniref:histidine kinase n=1 Tax=Dyadobacter fanqingshengii TaxID=2906443 RepID=A0A9X1TA50_9BACT|nr:tetratricopeptide repeat-containing sensor histidine kinase [Dyadobacter fanqingshengii]MCF0042125.1 tetratricopeptide repeat-containing sensor histidine kinase [Dyadobacter fanqingshengii]MCF2506315.1 tetratricopeptide repeat-containing sensor histidine kinase [Dyadobacter fanqingshengii]USJ35341.1 tetratricopeptide repeat-containing sensor histidine kinase [Dyadobacter fanqingshengii]
MRVLIVCALLMMSMIMPASGQVEMIRKLQHSLPQIKDSVRYVDAVNKISLLFYEQNADSTFYYSLRAREIATRLEYAKGIADATNNLGIVFDIKGNVQLALRYYNDAYNRYVAIGDSSNIVQTLMNIAMVYTVTGKTQKSIANFKQALELGNRIAHDSITAIAIYNYMLIYPGEFKGRIRDKSIERATNIAAKYNDRRMQLAIEQLRAADYLANNERDKGIELLKQILAKSLKMELYFFSMDLLINLGDQHLASLPDTSITYYKRALEISEQKGYRLYARDIARKLYDFYTVRNDKAQAYSYAQKLIGLFEEQIKIDKVSGIDYIEYAVKDQELRSEQVKVAYNKRFLWLAVAICVLTILSIGFLLRTWLMTKRTNEMLRIQFRQLETTMEALESTNENYARVIKIVAHDLRNPIGAINAMSGMLIDDDTNPQESREFIQMINESSKNCMTMIGDLLVTDFGLKESELNKEEIDLPVFLQQVIKLLIFRAKEKNQELVLSNSVNATILVDGDKLSRVLSNLVINAVKFSPEGGSIEVSTSETAGGILIAVKDNGLGIPKEFENKIFDPFTSSKRAGTAGEQPFGLGLYISKQIIEAHHGRIWFESEAGITTTFYILLPSSVIVSSGIEA